MSEKIEKLLSTANDRLKNGNTGITIFKRGSKLSLRGILPPKPGKTIKSQQTIALDIFANPAGIKIAEKEALKLSAIVALNQFDWKDYIKSDQPIGSVDYWIKKFEEDYFNKRDRNRKSEATWNDYLKIFKKFPESAKLSQESLMAVVLNTKPDTRSRKKACVYTSALARFAGIEFDPSEYSGNYSPESLNPRDIPTDEKIMEYRDRIPATHGWQYAFGLLAAYGLRNYELFEIDLESIKKSPGHLRIRESKRNRKKERIIWCLYPEWWEIWNLGNIDQPFPQVSGKDLGHRVSQAFRRYDLPAPYNFRHAWAIRAIKFLLPIEVAAEMMDHDVDIHRNIYQRWITEADYQQLYQLIMNRENTPKIK